MESVQEVIEAEAEAEREDIIQKQNEYQELLAEAEAEKRQREQFKESLGATWGLCKTTIQGFSQDFGIVLSSCHQFLKWFKIWQNTLYYIAQGILSKMAMREFSIFIFFSDTYTCSYVA